MEPINEYASILVTKVDFRLEIHIEYIPLTAEYSEPLINNLQSEGANN